MANEHLTNLLNQVASHEITTEQAFKQLNQAGFIDLDYAKVDTDRQRRTGYPEVIYGEGKTATQIIGIIQAMLTTNTNILVTRVSPKKAQKISRVYPKMVYSKKSRIMLWQQNIPEQTNNTIAIVTAGTSDLKIAEEAAVTAEAFGNRVSRIYDVGVAGIHRLFAELDAIRSATVVVVVAGMEGALPSVIGGLVDKPVIAVPTSVGYGTSFNGLSALLTMLNSCASGITVVNIDNGFGAGYSASQINHLVESEQ